MNQFSEALENHIKIEASEQDDAIKEIKSRKLLKNIRERQGNQKFYSWELCENYAYIAYLMNFRYIFDSSLQRKRVKVFRHLSKLIKSRNPHQIKSHHQKMMLRHENVDNIIQFVRSKVSKEIEANPDLIPSIELINKEAEIFFMKELGQGYIKAPTQQVSKRNDPPPVLPKTKIEDRYPEPQSVFSATWKESTPIPASVCLKEEQQENLIWQKDN